MRKFQYTFFRSVKKMARMKQTARKKTGGLSRATKDPAKSKDDPNPHGDGDDGNDAELSTSHGGRGKPTPKIISGCVDR